MVPADRFILEFDRALRTVSGVARASRPSPAAGIAEAELSPAERAESAALMRVNHVGEVCAQALYQGQALAARDAANRAALERAAREEEDHLAWSRDRIRELQGRTSLLNPVWYAGSLAIGAVAGLVGDRVSLGFLEETERQVERHLSGHLDRLPEADRRSRAIVAGMKEDEARHADMAQSMGAEVLPPPVRCAMQFAARIMTTLAHRI